MQILVCATICNQFETVYVSVTVQHCLVDNERKETLRTACEQFKEGCPSFDSVAVIIIDKDFTELAVLKEQFPKARVLLCHFHVVKYLQEEVAKERFNFGSWTKNEMKDWYNY